MKSKYSEEFTSAEHKTIFKLRWNEHDFMPFTFVQQQQLSWLVGKCYQS